MSRRFSESDQLHRLNQIGMQLDVPNAFREPEVSVALMLSNEQRNRIRSIEVETFAAMLQSLWPDPHPRTRAPFEVNSRPLARVPGRADSGTDHNGETDGATISLPARRSSAC